MDEQRLMPEPVRAEPEWAQVSAEMCSAMRDWHAQHPHATWRELEAALDERLARLRARMLEDLMQQRVAADWRDAAVKERPRCRQCGELLHSRGIHTRHLKTSGGQQLSVQRAYGVCPRCGHGRFPPR